MGSTLTSYAGRMPQKLILVGGQRLIMAIGGALRAAIKAGNWASAARESRRRARALADLNLRGGISNASLGPRSQGFRRGITYNDQYGSFEDASRGMDWDDLGLFGEGRTPRGNMVTEWPGGNFGGRIVDPPMNLMLPRQPRAGMRPIEAPYEGMRVLPGRVNRYGDTPLPPGPWQGRGQGTQWGELPIDGEPSGMFGTYFSPIRETFFPRPARLPFVEPGTWTFDDIAGSYYFNDPYTGFRYTRTGEFLD